MISDKQITGIVLAGGQSYRSASGTALPATCDEESLLHHAVELLKPFCREVFIGGDYPEYISSTQPILPDRREDLGVMGDIYAGLKHTGTPYLVFLTSDMPLMNELLVEQLLSAEPFREMTLWQQPDGTLQFFPLLLARSLETLVEYKIQQHDLSLRSLLKEATSRFIPIRHQEEKFFLNVYCEEDREEIVNHL